MKIAILTNQISIESGKFEADKFAQLLNSANDSLLVKIVVFENLLFDISANNCSVVDTVSGYDLSEFDVMYIKRTDATPHYGIACGIYATHRGVKCIDSEFVSGLINPNSHKLIEHMVYAVNQLPFPRTIIVSKGNYTFTKDKVLSLGFPVVMKSLTATRGADNYLVQSFDEFEKKLNEMVGIDFAVQPFIPNDSDYRFLTLGYETKLVIQRIRKDDTTHTNNTSQGADAKLIPLDEIPKELHELASRSAKAFNREIAGVDIMLNSQTGEAVILEVNRSPQIESGSFVEEKARVLAHYFAQDMRTR